MDGPTIEASVYTAWAETASIVGIVVGTAILAIRKTLQNATSQSPEMSVSRSDFMESFIRETQASREVTQAIRQAAEATRDAAVKTAENMGRIVTTQEAIVRIMELQANEERMAREGERLLKVLEDRERERNEENRRRPPHRD